MLSDSLDLEQTALLLPTSDRLNANLTIGLLSVPVVGSCSIHQANTDRRKQSR